MLLTPGARLGPFEVVGLIGAGGMGEVYRARDTRLDRMVALKVLPPEFASDPTLRARFEREAHAISALQHPHICTLHDVGEANGQAYLVMEHINGDTLADRLKKGPLPLPQALEMATQVAEALAAAHKQGIVHRDLKPGNVMLTRTGVKLLDFGLARLGALEPPSDAAEPTSTPTEAASLTGRGATLGTLPYMAPEQVEGRSVDARADIWALGAIVYEAVAGARPFEGRSAASLAVAILAREPVPLSTRQPLTPPALDRLVRGCLAKSPEDRWDTAHDVAEELRWIAQTGPVRTPPGGAAGAGWKRALGALSLAVVGLAVGVLVERALRAPAARSPAVVRSLLDVRPAEEVTTSGTSRIWLPTPGGSRTALAWTPDGRALVFVGQREGARMLYVRELHRDEARPLAGTDGARALAVSPDGQWVAFWADGAIKRVPFGGGPVATLVEGVPYPPTGIAIGASGDILYSGPDLSIWRASAGLGPTPVTKRLEAEVSHLHPVLLPAERALLYTVRRREWTWGDEEIVAQVLATGERKVLLRDAVDGRYVPGGHLVFLRRGTLFAVGFDPERLEVRGSPVALLDRVAQSITGSSSGDITGPAQFSVAPSGALAYLEGKVAPYPDTTLVAVDREGRVSPLSAPVRSYSLALAVSPDGRHLAVSTYGITERSLCLVDVGRGTLRRLTSEGEASSARWTPDGQRIAFTWLDAGRRHLAWQRSDGTTRPEVLVPDAGQPSSWSPDGRQLLFVEDDDLWVADVEGSRASARPITRTPNREWWPELSPDGRWLAYGSDVSGRFEVYVRPWPGPGPTEQVSIEGGESAAWSPAGGELVFLSQPDAGGKRRMMAVDVRTGPRLSVGAPRPLFDFSLGDLRFLCVPVRCYGVSPDGRRFFVTRQPPTAVPPVVTHVQLVLNWTEELKARVPSGMGH